MPTKTQDWAAVTTSSAEPAGTVTFGSGSTRIFILVQGSEHSGEVTASCAIGNVPATGEGRLFYDNGTEDLQVAYWYWNEADLGDMVGNTISYSETTIIQKRGWTYATFTSCDQATPIVIANNSSASVGGSGLTVATVGNSADYVFIVGVRDTGNRRFDGWGNLTEKFDVDGSNMKFGLGEGGWVANQETVVGDPIPDVMVLESFVLKAVTNGGGAGNIQAPSVTVSGEGELGINNLKPVDRTVSGVGERSVVWQGEVYFTAPSPTISTNNTQFGGSGDMDPPPISLVGAGSRVVKITGSPAAPLGETSSSGAKGSIGTGDIVAPKGKVASLVERGAVWIVAKVVYF